MNTIEQILDYLDGKKTYIGSIALIVIPFLALKGIIDNDTAVFLCTLVGLITGVGKYATDRVKVGRK